MVLGYPRCRRTLSHFVTNVSCRIRCGVLWYSRWLLLEWPPSQQEGDLNMKEVSITLKEMLPMILAGVMWGPEWR